MTTDRSERLGEFVGSALRWFPLIGLVMLVIGISPAHRHMVVMFFAVCGLLGWLHLTLLLWLIARSKRKPRDRDR